MKSDEELRQASCPRIMRVVEQFNRLNRWVASEVVLATGNAEQRLSVVKRFIKIAHHCRELHNLHSMYAIYVGLNMWAVQRLKQTWAALPGKWQKLYDELDALANPQSNSAALRSLIAESMPPIVPPLDILLRDFTALGELDEFVDDTDDVDAHAAEGEAAFEPPFAERRLLNL